MTEYDLGSKPQLPNLDHYEDRFRDWVSAKFLTGQGAQLNAIRPTGEDANGFAGESFIVTVSTDGANETKYLLKRKPEPHSLFLEHDFRSEYLVQERLDQSGLVPVSPAMGYEEDDSILGSPFYILGFVEGQPTNDQPSHYHSGWLKESSPELQRTTCVSAVTALGTLHTKTIEELGVEYLCRAAPGRDQLEWDLGFWDRMNQDTLERFDMAPDHIKQARDWLAANRPGPSSELVIAWGDARPGNMMLKDGACKAIIDFDLVSSGPPEKDLGYWLTFDNVHFHVAEQAGDSDLPGWLSREEVISTYEAALGRTVDRDLLKYYRVFAAWACSSMFTRFMAGKKSEMPAKMYAQYMTTDMPPNGSIAREIEDVAPNVRR